jgi:outer membrane receptor protein involved in Fe transport
MAAADSARFTSEPYAAGSKNEPDGEARRVEKLHLAQADEGTASGARSSNKQRQQQSKAKPEAEGAVLEEIVVTATKRKESIQKIPQAVTAVTAERLDELNAQTFDDYFRDVPGLAVITPGPGKRDFSMRGVSSGQISTSLNIDISTVSQYFDEIPVTASGFQMDPRLVDIDRIEVLRGPQGTYYGEGALGGMIRTITRKPVLNSFSGALEGRISNTQHGAASNNESGMLNLPIVADKAALRLNGFYAEDGGYIDAVDLNDAGQIAGVHRRHFNSAHSSGYRGVLLVEPTGRFSISGQVAHFESAETLGLYEPKIGDLLYGITPCAAQPSPPPGGASPPPGGASPPPGGASPPPDSSVQCEGGKFSRATRTANLYNLTLSGDLGWASLVSSSSYAKTGVELGQHSEFTNRAPGPSSTFVHQHLKGFTQELRLVSSKEWSEQWDYVFGAYYQDKDTLYDYPSDLPHTQDLKAKEKALFADAGHMLTKQLQVRLGLRTSDVSNTGAIDIPPGMAFPNGLHVPTDASFNPVTGRAVLDYFVNNDMMLYTSVGRGFRNGTLNDTTLNYDPRVSSTPGFTPIPDHSRPDTNTTYELGWKLSFPTQGDAQWSGLSFRLARHAGCVLCVLVQSQRSKCSRRRFACVCQCAASQDKRPGARSGIGAVQRPGRAGFVVAH